MMEQQADYIGEDGLLDCTFALIEQGESVLMTNFAKILNTLSGMYSADKNEFIASLI